MKRNILTAIFIFSLFVFTLPSNIFAELTGVRHYFQKADSQNCLKVKAGIAETDARKQCGGKEYPAFETIKNGFCFAVDEKRTGFHCFDHWVPENIPTDFFVTDKDVLYVRYDNNSMVATVKIFPLQISFPEQVGVKMEQDANTMKLTITPPSENPVDKGTRLSKQGRYDEAITELTKAIEISPDSPKAYNNRGLTYTQKGEFDKAILDFNKTMEISPNHFEPFYGRARAYAGKGEYDNAISDYTKVLEINPKIDLVYRNRAVAYYHKGDYEKAWEDVRKSESLGITVDPKFMDDLKKVAPKAN